MIIIMHLLSFTDLPIFVPYFMFNLKNKNKKLGTLYKIQA